MLFAGRSLPIWERPRLAVCSSHSTHNHQPCVILMKMEIYQCQSGTCSILKITSFKIKNVVAIIKFMLQNSYHLYCASLLSIRFGWFGYGHKGMVPSSSQGILSDLLFLSLNHDLWLVKYFNSLWSFVMIYYGFVLVETSFSTSLWSNSGDLTSFS